MQYEKLLTINLKSNSIDINFDISGKFSNENSNINLNIINNVITDFSYNNRIYGHNLMAYKISNMEFQIWIKLDNKDIINITNLKYNPLYCSIEINRKRKRLPGVFISKVNCILKHNYNDIYEIAKGSANTIILTIPELYDGYWKKFIANNNSNGQITINGKNLYKIGTTISPNLKKDKPYEVYYSLSKDCFFLKANATGTALPTQVLNNVTFSNEDDIDLIGSMPNNGAVNKTLNCGENYTIPKGYHNGGGKIMTNNLTNQTRGTATSSDILTGKTAWVNGQKITGTMSGNSNIKIETITVKGKNNIKMRNVDYTNKTFDLYAKNPYYNNFPYKNVFAYSTYIAGYLLQEYDKDNYKNEIRYENSFSTCKKDGNNNLFNELNSTEWFKIDTVPWCRDTDAILTGIDVYSHEFPVIIRFVYVCCN